MADEALRPIGLVVLGMHRSGTSALTRTIGLLGADLPTHVIGAGPGNASGHWEPEPLVAINDRLLEEVGSDWSDWRSFDTSALPDDRLQAYRAEIAACLRDEYGDSRLFALKDPRIARMFPLYREVLGSMGIEARAILCTRNPVAVIDSIVVRNDTSRAAAALLWLRHVLDAEAATRGDQRCVVSYETLLRDWRATTDVVAEALGIRWPRHYDEVGRDIDAFLAPGLQHHAATLEDLEDHPETGSWVQIVANAMESLTEDPSDAGALEALDDIRAQFDLASALFAAATFPELASRDQRIAWMDLERQRELERAERAEGVIALLESSQSWRITKPLREGARIVRRLRGSSK